MLLESKRFSCKQKASFLFCFCLFAFKCCKIRRKIFAIHLTSAVHWKLKWSGPICHLLPGPLKAGLNKLYESLLSSTSDSRWNMDSFLGSAELVLFSLVVKGQERSSLRCRSRNTDFYWAWVAAKYASAERSRFN